jgi:ABC-type transporter Mla MlaB component
MELAVIGSLDESSEVSLNNALSELKSSCVVDFSQTKNVNSCGVRAWIQFLQKAEKKAKISFANCVPDIVIQMNMIPAFKGEAKIISLQAPFFCEDCGQTKNITQSMSDTTFSQLIEASDNVACEKCQANMEFEEVAEDYYAFLEEDLAS